MGEAEACSRAGQGWKCQLHVRRDMIMGKEKGCGKEVDGVVDIMCYCILVWSVCWKR